MLFINSLIALLVSVPLAFSAPVNDGGISSGSSNLVATLEEQKTAVHETLGSYGNKQGYIALETDDYARKYKNSMNQRDLGIAGNANNYVQKIVQQAYPAASELKIEAVRRLHDIMARRPGGAPNVAGNGQSDGQSKEQYQRPSSQQASGSSRERNSRLYQYAVELRNRCNRSFPNRGAELQRCYELAKEAVSAYHQGS